jgi:hypothetical protein
VAWDPAKYYFFPFLFYGGIFLFGACQNNNKRINLLNLYGPCRNNNNLLDNLILEGDLNLTIFVGEIWGASATQDTLADFFTSLFLTHNLADYVPNILAPTWRNGQMRSESISKRLDHFLISVHLISTEDRICTWVDFPFLLDHASIILHLDSSSHKISYPFKLNLDWLLEVDFNSIVAKVWKDPLYLFEPCIQHHLIWKLKCLKAHIKAWDVTYKKHNAQTLLEIKS